MKVIILSGLPGSGKTTWAKVKIDKSDVENPVFWFSADLFWPEPYKENFDPKGLPAAHLWCYREYLTCLKVGAERVSCHVTAIVDNTNVSPVEIAPYYRLAEAFGHEVEILRFWVDPLLAFRRNVHGVPLGTIMAMHYKMLSEPLPPYWKATHLDESGIQQSVVS